MRRERATTGMSVAERETDHTLAHASGLDHTISVLCVSVCGEVGEIVFVVVRIFIEMVVYLPAQVYAKLLQGNVTDSPGGADCPF